MSVSKCYFSNATQLKKQPYAHALCRTQKRSRDDSRTAIVEPFECDSFSARRLPYARPHEPPQQGGASAALPQKWILVRCCTPSTRHALSTAAVWPPAALRVDPLLQHASQPPSRPTPTKRLHSINQPTRRATPRWECSKVLQLCARLDRIDIIDLVEAPLSVCVLPHLRLAQVVETTAAGDDPRRIRERIAS